MAWTLISMIWVSDSKDETVTHGMPYNFVVLNSPVIGHLGKRIIKHKWWNQFWWNLWFWIKDMRYYLSTKFQTQRSINFRDITETVTGIFAEEIGKLGLPVRELLSTIFRNGVHWTAPFEEIYLSSQSDLKYSKFFEIRVYVTNPRSDPRSASFGTKTDTSNQ